MMELAFDVASLAEHWRCSREAVYELIRCGQLRAFNVGKSKRGLRVSAAEVRRWENASGQKNIDRANSHAEVERTLRSSQIRISAKR